MWYSRGMGEDMKGYFYDLNYTLANEDMTLEYEMVKFFYMDIDDLFHILLSYPAICAAKLTFL